MIYVNIYIIFVSNTNHKSCRAAMMEFEINMSEMPLGKLSRSNIQKGKLS